MLERQGVVLQIVLEIRRRAWLQKDNNWTTPRETSRSIALDIGEREPVAAEQPDTGALTERRGRRSDGVHPTSLGAVLRSRRRQLELTQQQVARRVGVRANYIGYLERGMRRPSTAVLVKLAKVLDLDQEELFFLAHPQVRALIHADVPHPRASAWETFRANRRLHTRHGITRAELKALQHVASLGPARASRDYLFILQAIRQSLQEG